MYGLYAKSGVLGSIDRSCHRVPSWTSNCFDLNYSDNALDRYPIYQKDSQSNLFIDSREAQRGE